MIYTCNECMFLPECMMLGKLSSPSDPICENFLCSDDYNREIYENEVEEDG